MTAAGRPVALPTRALIGGTAHIEAGVSQAIRAVPILQHCLILVREGTKDMVAGPLSAHLETGDMALLPAGGMPDIGNHPYPASGRYRALALGFGENAVAAFRRHYPALAAERPAAAPPWQIRTQDAALAATVLHAAAGLADGGVSDRLACHRVVEVLAALAERSLYLPPDDRARTAPTVRILVAARPHLPWTAADAARTLSISEPTLRRRLAAEGTSFRAIVTEARLTHGLMLIQTSAAGIVEIALASGYESPSRFAARFRERFGVSPSELRGQPARAKADDP